MSQNNPAGNAGTGSTGTGSTGSSSPTSPAARPTSDVSTGGAAAGNVQGIHTPFDKPAKGETLKPGIDPKTRLFEGIAPDTHERISVSLDGLKAQFGDEQGEKKYLAIAGVRGGSVFFNPNSEATSYRPPLGISRLAEDLKGEVDEILATEVE